MRIARSISITAVICLSASCSGAIELNEIYGVYEYTTDGRSDQIAIYSNGHYRREIRVYESDSYVYTGTWVSEGMVDQNCHSVTFSDFTIGELTPEAESSPGSQFSTCVYRFMDSSIRILIDADDAVYYTKLER